MLTAWGDESGSDPKRDPGTYMLAAALIDESDVPVVRKTMSTLKLPIEPKLHWHGSSEDRRMQLVNEVADLPILALVVVRNEIGADDRRGRRKCLEHLLPNLAEMPCTTITFESRGPRDASDLDILQKFRATKVISQGLRLDHIIGRSEPTLWAADIACGAVVQHRVGNPQYLDRLGAAINIIEI